MRRKGRPSSLRAEAGREVFRSACCVNQCMPGSAQIAQIRRRDERRLAGAPNAAGVDKPEKIWRRRGRHDVFPVTFRSVRGFMGRADATEPHAVGAAFSLIRTNVCGVSSRNA